MSSFYGLDPKTKEFVSQDPLIFNTGNLDYPDPYKPLFVVKVPEPVITPNDFQKLIESSIIKDKLSGQERLDYMKKQDEKNTDEVFEELTLKEIFEGISNVFNDLINNGLSFFKEDTDIFTQNKKYIYFGGLLILAVLLSLLL